jgi:hypothetical protein
VQQEVPVNARAAVCNVLAPTILAACAAFALCVGAPAGHAKSKQGKNLSGFVVPAAEAASPLILAQNSSTPFTLPQMAEPPVSPINPGTLPGSTAAIGGSASGTNPITGLPCNGGGSLSVSGAGGLPGTATPPPGVNESLDQIPVGTPPTSSIYGTQSSLGPC